MNKIEYANIIIPNVQNNWDYYIEKYVKRDIPNSAYVLRSAPSPTGSVHIGSLMNAMINFWYAKQSNGVVYLRIEDTDQKRIVDNGVEGIINDFKNLGVYFDEDPSKGGNYAPYIQSQREDIYKSFAKKLIIEDLAYPCFCSNEDINAIRKIEKSKKDRIGYYGEYAKCRDLNPSEVLKKINNGDPYIIRFKSPGNFKNKIVLNDCIKGNIEFPENDLDVVIIKSDGLPTYHFAHVIDDYLMGTTHVIRSDEWLSSYPIHDQLFKVLGFKIPKYAHTSPINIKEGNVIRKISKRKDPWAAMSYYEELGIPNEAIKLYLATLTNSNFEQWYDSNNTKDISEFTFSFKKMSVNGPIFDIEKLNNISKTYISRMTSLELYNQLIIWSKKYDLELYKILNEYPDYSKAILNIERCTKKPRKDFTCYSEIKNHIWYMYDELFFNKKDLYKNIIIQDYYDINILYNYINNYYNASDDKEIWYNKIKELATKYNFACSVNQYKENPSIYKGHIGHICELIRIVVTSSTTTPDLYEILKLLKKDTISKRIACFNKFLLTK